MNKARKMSDKAIKAELAALAAMSDDDIDFSDIPERRDWRGAVRGKFYRPVKQVVTMRLDADVVAWFKARESRYQPAMNRALREYMRVQETMRSRRRKRAS
jgi:uncharacterized protein (DUF4415 family)